MLDMHKSTEDKFDCVLSLDAVSKCFVADTYALISDSTRLNAVFNLSSLFFNLLHLFFSFDNSDSTDAFSDLAELSCCCN